MRHVSTFITLLCTLWLTPAIAEPPLGSDLPGLLDHAREHNPALAATRFEAEAAQQRSEAADALPDPVLRTELMDITNGGTTGARLLPSQTGATRYTLMQNFPWYGTRDLLRKVADAQAAQASGQVAASWSDLAARIKQTHAMRYFTAASAQLTQQTLTLLDDLEQIAQTRYANGLGQQQDVIRVQVEKTMLKSELIALQNESHHTHARLNALLSRPVNAALAEPAQQRAMPPPAKLDEAALQQRLLTQNPQLRIAEAGIQSSAKSRDLAHANRYPGVTLGVAPTQSGSAVQSWNLMVELNIPLQQSSRRAQERESEALLSASTARKQAVLDRMQSELSENLSALESARRTDTLIATRLLPQAELTYRSALAGYETGKVDFTMLIEAQKQILKARQQQLQIQTDMQLRLADIERTLGEEL
ncbi:MAG: TolC family protein [Gammaproteobacteria bacterium]|nr:TolC family protein [Gammaproteobacteria bacterium]MBU1969294.1 TolC family protein [Gammaproteobacteria bacterium]